MNSLYRRLVSERIGYAIAAARAVASIESTGVKGAIREVLIAELFRPMLPSDIGVATGTVISAFDEKQSAQQDIIIFDRGVLPPLLFEQGPSLIPIESVLFTIEVKSRLTAGELRLAQANAASVSDLDMLSGIRDDKGQFKDVPTSRVPTVVFALDTDLIPAGRTEVERYEELFGKGPPLVSGICIAGRCSWLSTANATSKIIYDRKCHEYRTIDGSAFTLGWHEVKADESHSEIIEVLIGILDLYSKVSASRGKPPLRGYLRMGDSRAGPQLEPPP